MLFFFGFSTYTVFTGVSSDVPGCESSIEMMSAHNCTGHIYLYFFHWVTVVFLTLFLCVLKVGDNLSSRWMRPLMCVSSRCFLQNLMLPFRRMLVCFDYPLGVVKYSHDQMPKKKAHAMSLPIAVLKW